MSPNCVFTIVAKNYIGLAQVLESSLRATDPGLDFWIIVADEIPDGLDVPPNAVEARRALGYDPGLWQQMAFQYDITEFCTAIKPAAFQYLFARGYGKAAYLDPDTYFFSSIDPAFRALDTAQCGLTPHILYPETDYKGDYDEWKFNVNGIFNLGFAAMRHTPATARLLAWWRRRLESHCAQDRLRGNFTDQKWMDWAPALLPQGAFHRFGSPGMNLAPWNFAERRVTRRGDAFKASPRNPAQGGGEEDLMFVHFSGYDYKSLIAGRRERTSVPGLNRYDDLQPVLDAYAQALARHRDGVLKYHALPYSYAAYDNGRRISQLNRRLLAGLREGGHDVAQPFATGPGTLYAQLEAKKLLGGGAADKASKAGLKTYGSARRKLDMAFKALSRLMGPDRYHLLLKSFYVYGRPEEHTFLIDPSRIKGKE